VKDDADEDKDADADDDADEDSSDDMPEIAEMDLGDGEVFALNSDDSALNTWRVAIDEAMAQARQQIAEGDDAAREALEKAEVELEAAREQSRNPFGGTVYGLKQAGEEAQTEAAREQAQGAYAGVLRAHHEAEKAQVEAEAARAQAHGAYAGAMRAYSEAAAQAQDQARDQARESLERTIVAQRDAQEEQGQRKRAEVLARSGYVTRKSQGDSGLEARVRALEEMARASGYESKSRNDSLESRVAELERFMHGQAKGGVVAPRAARIVEVPGGVGGGSSGTAPKGWVAKPFVWRTPDAPQPPQPPQMPKVTMPKMPAMPETPKFNLATPGQPPTPAAPSFAPRGSMGRGRMSGTPAPGMDEGTRRDLERAMTDLRREADRLREEMTKLRAEIERLPKDGAR
jgi:chemotaxis protein histidine kinase CheA